VTVATPLNVRLVEALRRTASPAAVPTDRQLLDRFVITRDPGAFAELVRRHGPMVLGVCRRALGHAHDADDAFQVTFLALARRAGAVRGDGLAGWLHRVAARTARKAAARRRLPVEPTADRPAAADTPADVSWREVRSALDEELARLPARQRTALALCYLDGLPRDLAARRLGLPLGTFKHDLERGRRALRQRLLARGIAPAGLALATLAPDGLRAAVPPDLAAAALNAAGATGPRRAAFALVVLVTLLGTGAGLLSLRAGAARPDPTAQLPAAPPPSATAADEALPQGALHRLGTTRLRACKTAAFLPDGRLVVTRGDRAVLCDPETGRELRSLPGPNRLTGVLPSPDGKFVALLSDTEPVRLMDVANGREASRLGDPSRGVSAAAFTPDGKTLVLGVDKSLNLYDVATGKELRRCGESPNFIYRLSLSPDGRTAACFHTTEKFIRIVDLATSREKAQVGRYPQENVALFALAFAPDGRSVVAADYGEPVVQRWDVATGKEVARYEAPELFLHAALFSPDGSVMATAADAERYTGYVVRLWDLATGQVRRTITVDVGSGRFAAMAYAPDGKTLAVVGEDDGTVHLLDTATGRDRTPGVGHLGGVAGVGFTPDGRSLVSVGLDRSVCVWDPETGALRQRRAEALRPPPVIAFNMHVTAQGLLTASGPDHAARSWDLTALREGWRRDLGDMGVVGVSPDGRLVAAVDRQGNGRGCPIHLIETATGKERPPIAAPGWAVTTLVFSPDSRTLAASVLDHNIDSRIALWDVASGRELRQWTWNGDGTLAVAFSPDGRRLATTGGGPAAHVWDVATGRELRRLKLGRGPIATGLAFSPDGRTVALASGPSDALVWELASGQVRRRLAGHLDAVNALAFSPDGRTLASGSHDTTILLWDLTAPDRTPPADLPALWAGLADPDAARADPARRELAARGPAAVAFLSEHLRPRPAVDPARLERLIADLGAEQYARRNQATAELEALAELAEPALKRALAGQPTAELRRRAERLLSRLDAPLPPDQLRELRAVEALEQVGGPDARRVLETVAAGAEGAWLTRDAHAALGRWKVR
jgi:RNA polymerase sigma factor (sigma-70 family)